MHWKEIEITKIEQVEKQLDYYKTPKVNKCMEVFKINTKIQ